MWRGSGPVEWSIGIHTQREWTEALIYKYDMQLTFAPIIAYFITYNHKDL